MSSRSWKSPTPDRQQQPAGPLRRLLPASGDTEAPARYESNVPPAIPITSPTPSVASSSASAAPAAASFAATGPQAAGVKKKRQATTAACSACRKRKSKCDGQRPKCSVCRDRGTSCAFETNATETHTQALKRKYSELQSQLVTFEQIFHVLQTRPDKDAEEVFQRIRRGADAGSILRHVNYGDVLVQLALVPETRFRFEFPYISEMPIWIRNSDSPYLDSEIYDCALRSAPRQRQPPRLLGGDSHAASDPVPEIHDPYLKPYSTATIEHPYLSAVEPSKWTSVSSDDALMRKILHDYLLYEYSWFTYFHMDYFLEDMVNGRPRYCTSLLVNCMLCVGCFTQRGMRNRFELWNPKNLAYQFNAEARRLFDLEMELEPPATRPGDPSWEEEQRDWELRRLTTIQAALFFNLISNFSGTDRIGWRFANKAIAMALEIGLFQPEKLPMDQGLRCVRSTTAWGLFVWQSLSTFHYVRLPLLRDPPEPPLPDPAEACHWYGDMWLKYPLSETRLPTHHGLLFKAKADLWTIVNNFSLLTFSDPLQSQSLLVDRVFHVYQQLNAWFQSLPEPLTPKRIALPHPLKLHMHYQLILIDILKPIIGYSWSDPTTPLKSPRDAYVDAKTHLETLLRIYYLRHGYEACDGFLLHLLGAFQQIAISEVLENVGSPALESWRSSLLLVTKGMHEQAQSYFTARAITRFQMSLMRGEELELLRRYVGIEPHQYTYGPMEQTFYSDWPVYEPGFDKKAEQKIQGVHMASLVASLTLEPSGSSSISSAGSPAA